MTEKDKKYYPPNHIRSTLNQAIQDAMRNHSLGEFHARATIVSPLPDHPGFVSLQIVTKTDSWDFLLRSPRRNTPESLEAQKRHLDREIKRIGLDLPETD